MQAPDYEEIWPVIPDSSLDQAVEKAQTAFWQEVAKAFPEVPSGDYPPDVTMAFDTDCKRAIAWWLYFNHPKIGK